MRQYGNYPEENFKNVGFDNTTDTKSYQISLNPRHLSQENFTILYVYTLQKLLK